MRGALVGGQQLVRNLRQYGVDVQRETERAVNATAQQVRTTAVKKIQRGPATGRTYQLYTPNRVHQASAPGQPPQTDTGALASSVAAVVGGLDARVGTGLEYGRHLEFGTVNMEPRPWLHPSLREVQPDHNRRMDNVLDQAARRIRF